MGRLGVLFLLAWAAPVAAQPTGSPAEDLADVLRREAVTSSLAWIIALEGGQAPGAAESRLVRLAAQVSLFLGYEPDVSPKGCCNMAVPVAHGRLAIGLHGERGGLRASAEEWASIPAMVRTAKHVALLAAAY
jgi:hypothetical protein